MSRDDIDLINGSLFFFVGAFAALIWPVWSPVLFIGGVVLMGCYGIALALWRRLR